MSLSRQQLTLLGIIALFMGPLILAMLMRSSWWQFQPAGQKNHGHLVQPPIHLSLDQARGISGKWLILYALDQPCAQKCIDHVTSLRQIHRASGKYSGDLAIILLNKPHAETTLQPRLESIYPKFILLPDPAGAALTTLDSVNAMVAKMSGDSGAIHTYILDPMSNVILAYSAGSKPNDIYKDLKLLLKWSERGKTG